MKTLLNFFIVSLVLAAGFALADRTDVWLASSVQVQTVTLQRLPAGGCSVTAFASMTKQDGGAITERSAAVSVGGANLATCLDILDNKAPALFVNDKGL